MDKKSIKKIEELTQKQNEKLQKMVNDMLDIAANVIEEYNEVTDDSSDVLDMSELSNLSGSLTQIHEDSPFLDELLEGDSWKRVIKNIPQKPKMKEDDDTK